MTPIPGPIILLALPLLAAGATYVVRRWAALAAATATVTSGALAVLCLRLPLDRSAFVLGQEVSFGRPVVLLGRELLLDPAGQIWLAGIFSLAALFYLLAWRISQGRAFFPLSLAILSLYALVTLLQTFSLAVLAFAVSVTLAVLIVQKGPGSSVRGAQRYLVVSVLAVPLLLAAAWLIEQSLLVPENAEMARQALFPATLGFGLLLAVFPFGTWMPAVATDAPSLVTAFVFTAGQSMALFLALVFLRDEPWVLRDPAVPAVIQLAGLVMAASGGIMASVQRDFGRLLGYAALSDMGFLLLALLAGGSQSQTLVMLHAVGRALSITLMAAALGIVRQRATTDSFHGLRGVARRLPIPTMGLLIGGLALAGFPLTAGLPTHWAVSRAVWSWAQPFTPLVHSAAASVSSVSGRNWVGILSAVALLASSTGILIGLCRGLSAMLGAEPRNDVARQPVIASFMILALIGLVIVLGVYPQLFLQPVQSAAGVFSSF